MARLVLISLFYLMGLASTTYAQPAEQGVVKDPAANFVAGLFMSACIPAIGKPDEVEKWAVSHNLAEIHDPTALSIFVGPGEGKAWGAPQSYGSFALSIRGKTKACAAWARDANGDDAEKLFRILMERTRRPSLELNLIQDQMVNVSDEHRHVIAYTLYPQGGKVGVTAMAQTTKRAEDDAFVELEIVQSGR